MLPALLLAAALALVGYNLFAARSSARWLSDRIGWTSRRQGLAAWAAGTFVTWGGSTLVALLLLGRLGTIAGIPGELVAAAWTLGLPAFASWAELGWLGLALAGGMTLGFAILVVRRWLGKPPGWIAYRSSAAAEGRDEFPAAALLALSAGVSEELFFRLLLPLLVALVTGSGLAGLVVGWLAFTALHRHQGWAGLILVGIVGVALTYLYLLTGRLWVAMLMHTVIDLNAFIARPWLSGFRTSTASRSGKSTPRRRDIAAGSRRSPPG